MKLATRWAGPVVAIALLVVSLAVPQRVAAQQECPLGYTPISWINGLYPGSNILVCTGPGTFTEYAKFRDVTDDMYPCGQQYETYSWQSMPLVDTQLGIWLGHPISNEGRIRFILNTKSRLFTDPPDHDEFIGFSIEYYNSSGLRLSNEAHLIGEYPRQLITVLNDAGYPANYWMYFVDELFVTGEDQSEGNIVIKFSNEPAAYFQLPIFPAPIPITGWEYGAYRISSLQVASSSYTFPDFCHVDGGAPAPTVTPTPTPQVAATSVPTGTIVVTPSPYPTAWGTPSPYPTPTFLPIVFPTVRSEATATAWPLPQFRPVDWPTVPAIPTPAGIALTVEADVVAAERATRSWEMANVGSEMATRWAGPVEWAEGALGWGGADITGTVNISSTAGAFGDAVEYIAMPVRMVRTVREYMPNMWPVLATILSGFLVVVAYYIGKFAIMIVGNLVEIIRRIWEVIPFN